MAAAQLAPVPVAFVGSHALAGGSEVYLERLLGELGPEWVRGVVFLQDGPSVARMRALGHPVEVVDTPARMVLPAALRLRRTLRRQRPSVVHANGVKAALLAVLATRGAGIPVVWVKHDFSFDGPLARAVARGCRRVVAVSRPVAATLRGRLGERVTIVPNGVPAADVDAEAARALVRSLGGWPDDAPVVGAVGRLDPGKGQLELVEAAPAVLARVPEARFLVLGDPDRHHPGYARTLRARAAELGLEARLRFEPSRDDALAVMAGCDLVAIPSLPGPGGRPYEGFGLVGVEAMSVDTPVVGYATGAMPDVLGDCARLVAPGDRDALGAAIADLLADASRRRELAACGRARVAERYRLDTMAEAMATVYRDAAAGG